MKKTKETKQKEATQQMKERVKKRAKKEQKNVAKQRTGCGYFRLALIDRFRRL